VGLQAAFGKVNITPEEHAPLQGYDPSIYIADPHQGILDDLYARILLLDDGVKRKVIVSVDCCLTNEVPFLAVDPSGHGGPYRYFANTFPEGTRREWGQAAGTDETSVSVHATHTHSAPAYFGKKYTSRITNQIRELTSKLQPVRIKAASGQCSVSVNRRPRLQHNDELPIDRSLNLLWFETNEGRPLGALVNCAVHPTLLMNTFDRVTTEFVGWAMNELEDFYGNSFISLFIQGFAGDVGPIHHYRTETYDTYPLVRRLGHTLYQDIEKIIPLLSPVSDTPLRSEEMQVTLPARKEYYKPTIELTLHGLRLGDVVLLSCSGEIFNGYVQTIASQSSFAYTLFSGVANGYHGYLPTLTAFRDGLGGYEINTTPYDEQASDAFTQASIQFIHRLHED
jgi:hypothetical protein